MMCDETRKAPWVINGFSTPDQGQARPGKRIRMALGDVEKQ